MNLVWHILLAGIGVMLLTEFLCLVLSFFWVVVRVIKGKDWRFWQ